jgi:hypothetical protein
MNDKRSAVVATFETMEQVNAAVRGLRHAGLQHTTIHSPVNSQELQGEVAVGESRIGFLAFGGAVTGATAGLLLTIGTSIQQPMITGGQPIISLPPFFVISFELAILFGVIATVLGMLWGFSRNRIHPKIYHRRFSADRFGLHVVCDEDQIVSVKNLLATTGAEEVRDEKF